MQKPEALEFLNECELDEVQLFAQCRMGQDIARIQFTQTKGKTGLRCHRLTIQDSPFVLLRTRRELESGLALIQLHPVPKTQAVYFMDDLSTWVADIGKDGDVTFRLGFAQVWKDGRVILSTSENAVLPGPTLSRGKYFGFNLYADPWADLDILRE